jgi:hypothetical protein
VTAEVLRAGAELKVVAQVGRMRVLVTVVVAAGWPARRTSRRLAG